MRKKSTPKVSVLTPIYNTNPVHLRECIESILNQTFIDFEFLILNDSPDNKELKKIVKSYKDPRIVYTENKSNIGISASRNKLLEMARGEYVAIFDHDDISLPARLEKEAAYLDANKFVGVVSCNIRWFPKTHVSNHQKNNLDIKRALTSAMVVAHTACMIRKSVLMENDVRWEEKFSPAEDYMLMVRLIEHTMFHNIQEVLVRYRFYENNTTNLQKDKMRDADALIKNIAAIKYPHLLSNGNAKKKEWLRLFGLIPFIKIKCGPDGRAKYYLFGAILLLYRK
jgi:glycosyltransferase involved in cell wall biosynthesis